MPRKSRWDNVQHNMVNVHCCHCGLQIRRNKDVAVRPCFCSRKCFNESDYKKFFPRVTKGRKQSAEHIANRAAALKGKKRTGQALENIRRASRDPKNHRYGPDHPNWRPGSAERRALKKACHGFIWNSMHRVNKFAVCPSYDVDQICPQLGYSPRQLAEHLEKQFVDGMTWANHARTGWHIDHIRPISSFPPGTPLSVINALDNLRPLWYAENLRKSNKWNDENNMETA